MNPKPAINASGLNFIEWLHAAGRPDMRAVSDAKLLKAWKADEDPSEYRQSAPKRRPGRTSFSRLTKTPHAKTRASKGLHLAYSPANQAYVFVFHDTPERLHGEDLFYAKKTAAVAAARRHGLAVLKNGKVIVAREEAHAGRSSGRAPKPGWVWMKEFKSKQMAQMEMMRLRRISPETYRVRSPKAGVWLVEQRVADVSPLPRGGRWESAEDAYRRKHGLTGGKIKLVNFEVRGYSPTDHEIWHLGKIYGYGATEKEAAANAWSILEAAGLKGHTRMSKNEPGSLQIIAVGHRYGKGYRAASDTYLTRQFMEYEVHHRKA